MAPESMKPQPGPATPQRKGLMARLAELADFKLEPTPHERFAITEVLGSGAMSNVFRAADRETDSEVALKVANENRPSRIAIRREGKYLSSLDHPAIVSLRCRGILSGGPMDGHEFISLERLEGSTLSHRLGGGARMPVEEAVQLTLQLCGALSHVHASGIVHRDIKPDNVMLLGDKVKLIDFGTSEPLRKNGLLGIFRLSFDPGDLSYSAPEVYRSSVDQRTDIFSVGSLLYRVLGGKTLDPIHHLSGVPVDLAHLASSGASPALCRAIAKSLERMPEDRFQSVAELELAICSS